MYIFTRADYATMMATQMVDPQAAEEFLSIMEGLTGIPAARLLDGATSPEKHADLLREISSNIRKDINRCNPLSLLGSF